MAENNLFVKPEKYLWKVGNFFRSDDQTRQIKNGEGESIKSSRVLREVKNLYKIMRKDVKYWKEKQQKIFKKLKMRFITEPILIILDLDKKIRV